MMKLQKVSLILATPNTKAINNDVDNNIFKKS